MNSLSLIGVTAGTLIGALLGGVFLGGPISGIGIGTAMGAGVSLGWIASRWSDD